MFASGYLADILPSDMKMCHLEVLPTAMPFTWDFFFWCCFLCVCMLSTGQPTFGNVIRDNVAETVDIGSEVPFSGSLIPPTLTGLHLYHNGELAKEDDIVSFTLLPWFVQLSIRNMSSQTAGIYQIIGHNDYGYEQIVLLYVLSKLFFHAVTWGNFMHSPGVISCIHLG